MHACSVIQCLSLCDLWIVAGQATHPWTFPGKTTGVGCHFLLQGGLPDTGIEPMSPASPALAGGVFTTEPPRKSYIII